MSARTRRSLTLFWTALFVLSLLMQYATFAAAPPVSAAHDEGIFELDGNAVDQAAAGADWQNGAEGSLDQFFVGAEQEEADVDVTYFTGGGSKDEEDIPAWDITDTSVPDKDELLDAYAAVYEKDGDTWVYFGADRFDNDGTAQIGFWFFQDEVGIANGDFTGEHVDGDVLILSEYTNGGVVSLICAYEWDGSGGGSNIAAAGDCDPATSGSNLNLVAAGTQCDVADGTFSICAITNDAEETAPWPFTNKDAESHFDPGQFFEGGINLSDMFGGDPPCFGTFLAETRSSAETDAQLKDFALGSLDTCVPPTITTTSSVSTADFGQQVTDTANLSGTNGAVTGSVKFFICTPTQVTAAGCPAGAGAQVGSAVTITAGAATSSAYTVGSTAAAAGTYCWRAEYTPDAASEYLAGSHTNATTECFTVAPAAIDVTKTADAAAVNAGEQIGFTVTLANTGAGTANGLSFTDNLPGGTGVSWSISPASVGWSITGTAPNQSLVYSPTTLAGNTSTTVHVVSNTTKDSCKVYDNTASATTTNDGSDSASASTEVRCAAIDVSKTADAATVNAGESIGFTVTLSNTGTGTATGLSFTDNLPGGTGVSWSISPASAGWSITGSAPNQSLVYSPTTLAGGASTTVHVVSNTTGASCKIYNNTASVTTANDGSDSASASTTVNCPIIDVVKTADAASVNAGEQIGFTVTLSNNGAGLATGLTFTDTLPGGAGVSWSISPASAGWSITGTAPSQSLVYSPTTLAANSSTSVHVVSNTTGASCGDYDNTASASTTNDGQDSDSASTEVRCAVINVDKTADAGSVNAGEQIGFTVTLSNTGSGTASGLAFTDTLPGGAGISWSISPASTGWSITGTAPSQSLVYSPTTLAANTSTSVHVVSATTGASCGQYDNTASVTTTNDGSDSANASTEVRCADIDVDKTADAATVNAGDQIGFTVTLANTGTGVASGLAFTDALPGGPGISWSISPASAGWSITGTAPNQSLVYTPTTLAGNTSTSVHVVSNTTGASCGQYDNTASVTTTNDGSDSASASTEVKCADIDVDKTADAAFVTAGSSIGFTVTLSNTGTGVASGLAFTDALPGGPGINWSISPASAGWSITGTAPTQSLVYSPTTLAGNTSTSVHVVSNTTGASCGQYDNTASVTTTNDGSDQSSASTQVRCVDLNVTKLVRTGSVGSFAGTSTANPGDVVNFQITITNVGDAAATNVAVSDDLSALLAHSVYNNDCSDSCSKVGNVLNWTIASIAANGGSETLTFSVTLNASFPAGTTQLPNVVVVTGPGSNCPEASTDPDCDTTTTVGAQPDLNVTKLVRTGSVGAFAPTSTANAGDVLNFQITITNTGKAPATNVPVSDDLTALLAHSTYNNDCSDSCSKVGNVLSWTIASIAANGGSETLTFSVTLSSSFPTGTTHLPNVVVVTGPGSNCPTASTDPDCDTNTTVQVRTLTIDKSFTGNTGGTGPGGVPEAKANDTLTYTLAYDITNPPVHNGVITDVIPVGLNYVAGSATGNAEFSFSSYNATTRTLTWNAALVTADGSVTYKVKVAVGADELPQPLVNIATIDSDETDKDDDTERVFVEPPPQIATGTPRITLPPTNTLDRAEHGTSSPGHTLMLVLLGLAGLALAVGFVTPVPARARRRNRR